MSRCVKPIMSSSVKLLEMSRVFEWQRELTYTTTRSCSTNFHYRLLRLRLRLRLMDSVLVSQNRFIKSSNIEISDQR